MKRNNFNRGDAETRRGKEPDICPGPPRGKTPSQRLRASAVTILILFAAFHASAQTAPATPAEIGTWLNIAILLINSGCAITMVLTARRSARREVTFGFVPAGKEEFDRHVLAQAEALKAFNGELAALREEMRKDRDQILLAGENRVSKLHERINTILEAVSEMRGRISTH